MRFTAPGGALFAFFDALRTALDRSARRGRVSTVASLFPKERSKLLVLWHLLAKTTRAGIIRKAKKKAEMNTRKMGERQVRT
jgi:hypothetical protein